LALSKRQFSLPFKYKQHQKQEAFVCIETASVFIQTTAKKTTRESGLLAKTRNPYANFGGSPIDLQMQQKRKSEGLIYFLRPLFKYRRQTMQEFDEDELTIDVQVT
jgi:hypothetical protein